LEVLENKGFVSLSFDETGCMIKKTDIQQKELTIDVDELFELVMLNRDKLDELLEKVNFLQQTLDEQKQKKSFFKLF